MKAKLQNQMPTSPHLMIYRWQINMFLSICHRITGSLLYFFLIFITWFFCLSLMYPDCSVLSGMNSFFLSGIGKFFIGSGSFMFYHHLFGGIRHLFWDAGCGFEIPVMKFTSILILFCSLILTGMTFFVLYF